MRLKTDRLVLRELVTKDAAAITKHCGDLRISQYLSLVPHPYHKKHAEGFLEGQQKNQKQRPRVSYAFAISLSGDRALVGIAEITKVDRYNGSGQLGYWLAQEHWGKGYMPEAVRALCEFGFEKLKLRRLHADVYVENKGSARVLEKAGFRQEALHRQKTRSKATGKVHDVYHYALLRDEWQKT